MSSSRAAPRRSTRSQSRGMSVLSTDSDVVEVARPAPLSKPRASTRRVKKAETILEDEVILAEEAIPPAPAPILVEEEEEEHESIEEEHELHTLEEEEKQEVDVEVKSAPLEAKILKPNKLRQRILDSLHALVRILPHLPPFLVAVCFILAALTLSPSKPFARKVYVDENALQPGSATVDWGWSQVGFADSTADKIATVADSSAEVRASLLARELQAIGLTAHNQSYTFKVPVRGGIKRIRGINTYARFPAARGDGREAFVIAASWKSAWDGTGDPDAKETSARKADVEGRMSDYERKSVRRSNVRGIASTIVLARHLSGYHHWSKDLIFVFSDGEIEGMQAWSSAYFGKEQSNLEADRLDCGGAAIWNALAIDYPSDSYSHVVIKHEGLQGQLPNLDVINAFTRIAQRTDGLPVSLSASSEHDAGWSNEPLGALGKYLEHSLWKDGEGAKKYVSGLLNVANQIGFLSAGRPSGIHGVFHQYHVDAITIFLRPASGPYGFHHLGRAVESMTRSMSNLLERLHHSQFFYLLTSPYRFIEVATYLPVAALLSVALTIVGISIWINEGERSHHRKSALVDALRDAIEEEKHVGKPANANGRIAFAGDTPLANPTAAQLLSTFIDLLVDRSLQRGDLIGTNKLRSAASLMQVFGRPVFSATVLVLSCHLLGGLAYYLIARAPVDCAVNGLQSCKPLRLMSSITSLLIVLIVWQIRRSNRALLSDRLRQCQALLPATLLPFLSSLQLFRAKAVARTAYSLVVLETGMLMLAISLVNFSLALVFGAVLCVPLCAFTIPASTSTVKIDTTRIDRSVSPASDDTGHVESLTLSVVTSHQTSLQTKLRLWTQAGIFFLLSPFSILYLGTSACHAACRILPEACSASINLDWAFDDTLLQHHLLGTLTLPFVTLVYMPIVLVASAANSLAALG